MQNIKEVARKYDRSLVAIATGVGIVLTTYLTIGNKIDIIISKSECVKDIQNKIELNEKLQDQLNKFIIDRLNMIDKKLDRILDK